MASFISKKQLSRIKNGYLPSVTGHELKGQQKIHQYISGGHGVVTLVSPTGVFHSYKFRKPKEPHSFDDGILFCYSRSGNKKWEYVGMMTQNIFRATRMSEFPPSSEIFKGASYIVRMATDSLLRSPMKLYHEGYCCVCGRRLTSLKAIEDGMGSKCKRRMKQYGVL